ncbi:MAG: tetratricopeptide repeat protein, partial [Myxococcota bacterium]
CMHAILAGHLYEHQDALDNAVEFYSKAFAANPFRGKAFDALVRIHSERRDAKTVRELFDKVGNTDTLALAYALEDAADTAGAATLYKAALDGFTPDANAAEVLPTLLRYEYALTTDERWTEVFDLLETRLHHTQDPHERALVEAKRRWILAERMADSDEAWDFYRKLHEEQPEDRDVLEALARIAGARGESDLAIQFLDGLANIAPTADDAARYQRRVAEVHLAGNNSDEARQSFLRALDHLPGDMEALTGLKEISKEAEDWQGYVGIIAREIHLLDGESKIARAREAAEVWETKLEDLEVASDAWRKVLELVPGDQTALQHLVNLGKQQKDWGGFIDHGKALVHYLDGEERAELLGQMGHAAYQYLRREEEAIRLLDEASLATPPNLQAAEILEQIHSGRGAWDLAVECLLRRARASEGETAAELFLRAARTRRDSLRDRKGASAIYAEALEHNPHEPEALQFQGEFLFENGDLKGAVAIFEQVESLDTDHDMDDFDVKMDLSLYYYRFGEALRRLSRTDDSLKRYEQALQLNNSHLPTLEAVGPLYVKLERWDDASRMFRQILQLTGGQGDPVRLARVYGNLGLVEHAQGNTEKAVRRFNKALELQPNDVPALRGYARVLYEKKDWNNLLTAYNNIIYHAKEREEFIHAYMMKGFVLDAHMALPDKAGQHYEKSLSFDASNPTALLRLAELALRKDDWDRASSFGGRALAVSNDSPDHVKALLHLVQGIATNKAGNEEGLAAGVSAAVGISSELAKLIEGSEDDIDSLQTIVRERLQEGL